MYEQTVARESVEFSSQLSPDLLESMKSVAREEGRQLQSVFEEAVTLYLQQRSRPRPRAHALEALDASLAEHDELYRELAK